MNAGPVLTSKSKSGMGCPRPRTFARRHGQGKRKMWSPSGPVIVVRLLVS